MTITFYSKKDYRGTETVVDDDLESVSSEGRLRSAASVKLTSDDDKILLFRKRGWDGGLMYLRGKQSLPDLGNSHLGGKTGFRNGIRSVRVSPFEVRLRYHIITHSMHGRPERRPVPGAVRAERAE